MSKYTKQDIIELVEEEDVEFIRLQFTDIYGTLKNMAVTTSQLEKILNNQCKFDGAAIEGFTSNDKSDLYLHPVLDTFEIFPWRPQQGKVARFLCDVYHKDGTPFEGDSRFVLKKITQQAEEMGYSFDIGSECEFYLFQAEEDGSPSTKTEEKGGFFDIGPIDRGENVRREIVLTLEDMGFEVEASYHEAGASQHQIDFRYDSALNAADNIMTFRMVVRIIAKRHGLHATFMPKPLNDSKGSGMNVVLSILKDGKNIFETSDEAGELCEEAKWFIAGILKHNSAITAIANPIINSYKRLVPNYNVPAYNGWSVHNRNASIRVPNDFDENSKVELRSPDSSANPYLVFALYLAAGLEGVRTKAQMPESLPDDTIKKEEDNRTIKRLPKTLIDSIEALEQDTFIQSVLGKQIAEKFIEAKKREWSDYCSQVSAWEVEQYLYRI
ncbi:type I glutamate--ammonia ligase [Anaerosporobacter faecicola]|uniref:type I glutamate--ammonia ligase n=1 Tax=Anaerosporobacter faecicola TaxID=2718714 RepID=UPI00143B1C38|nr:type I glutamate--ammonia ligase [Anaerosporobacter faecicola]